MLSADPEAKSTDQSLANAIDAALRKAGAEGWIHARDIDGGMQWGHREDVLVATASTFKVPVALAIARRVAAGELNWTDRVRVPASGRTGGITGLSGWKDDTELSWRDLTASMLTVSDNCATDVVLDRLGGVDDVNSLCRELGLSQTVVPCDIRTLFAESAADGAALRDAHPDLMRLSRVSSWDDGPGATLLASYRGVNPSETMRTTPSEMTKLLSLIWRDEAGPAEACADVRDFLGRQVWSHRLSSGFGDEVRISGKTGTLPPVRNEVGVVEYPDGGRYAVAVYTRAYAFANRQPDLDRAIGVVGRMVVDHLRLRAGSD